jgi:hypothetical protein
LQNDIAKKSPSVDLILGLLAPSLAARLPLLTYFAATSPLRRYGLLENVEAGSGDSAGQNSLRMDPRVMQYLLGNQAVDPRVQPYWRFCPALAWEEVVVDTNLQNRLQKLLQMAIDSSEQRPILSFSGRPGVGKKTLARALSGDLGAPLAVVDARALPRDTEAFSEKVRLILREGLLQPCAVYFDHLEKLLSEESTLQLPALVREIRELGWLTFLGSETRCRRSCLILPRFTRWRYRRRITPDRKRCGKCI